MRKYLLALLVIVAAITQAAALPPANDVTRFPGAIYVYKYATATYVQGRDSVGSRLGSFGRVRADTVNGYVQATYQVLDSALTGYATNPTDTLRLVCGANVSGYFVAGITGTSNGAALTIGHLPAACRPSHTVLITLQKVTDNGVTRYGVGSVATTGIITVSKTDTMGVQSATFTSSGTKGVGAGVSFTFPRF